MKFFGIILIGVLLIGSAVSADSIRPIRLLGRDSITVTTGQVRLSDIAEISAISPGYDEAVIGLQKIIIDKSPQPGGSSTIGALKIVDRLRAEGVNTNQLSYTFPSVVNVKRAARVVNQQEVEEAVKNYVRTLGRDMEVARVDYRRDQFVGTGDLSFSAQPIENINAGRIRFKVTAHNHEEPDSSFVVTASIDEWSDVPIAKRSVTRGATLTNDDLMMARVNLATVPQDTVHDISEVIGREAGRDINYGDTFRAGKLVTPPVINAGSKVTLRYQGAYFEATATGQAMENGAAGQDIKVKNDRSMKIVVGTVIEPGLVAVRP